MTPEQQADYAQKWEKYLERQREKAKKRYATHKEVILEKTRDKRLAKYAANAEQVKADNLTRYYANREPTTL